MSRPAGHAPALRQSRMSLSVNRYSPCPHMRGQRSRRRRARLSRQWILELTNARYSPAMADSVDRLYDAVLAAKREDPATSRTSRLLHAGRAKMATNPGEEAFEVMIDSLHDNHKAPLPTIPYLSSNLPSLHVPLLI